jgi:hypothetical protein
MTLPHMRHLQNHWTLRIEYADFLKRLDAFNARVARFRKAGMTAHFVPRLTLRHLNAWARVMAPRQRVECLLAARHARCQHESEGLSAAA